MTMDIERVRAHGPWVLVIPEVPKKRTSSGLYVPDGNLPERLGHVVARVVSVGKGYWEKPEGSDKKRFIVADISPGERAVFRGYLKNANKVGNNGYCFMHLKDLIGVLLDDADLDLCLPYND